VIYAGRRPLDGTSRGLDASEYLSGVPEEHRTCLRKAHAPLRSQEESRSQLVLQLDDLTANRRLRDTELRGSPAHVTLFGNGDEVFDLGEAHGLSG
jgi:hypothetical protein